MGRDLLLAAAVLMSTAAGAREYRVDDLLRSQSYGEVVVAERAGLVLFERRRPYDEADDYSLQYFVRHRLSNIETADLQTGRRLAPLFPEGEDAGYFLGPLSPSGRRLAVFRIRSGSLSLGVIDLETRAVRWLSSRPDLPLANPAPTWISEDRLAFVAMPSDRLPYVLSVGNALQQDLPSLWRRQRMGNVPSSDAFSARSGPEVDAARRLFVIADVRSGDARTLAEGAIVDASVSPDRSRIALLLAGRPAPPPSGAMDTSFVGRTHSIAMIDVAGRRLGDTSGDVLPGTMVWDRTGSRLLVVAGQSRSGWTDARFATVDRRGRMQRIGGRFGAAVTTTGSTLSVGHGWLGRHPLGSVIDGRGQVRWAAILDRGFVPLDVPVKSTLIANDGIVAWFATGSEVTALSGRGRSVLGNVEASVLTHLDPFSVGTRYVPRSPVVVASVSDHAGRQLRLGNHPSAAGPSVGVLAGDRVLAMTASAAVVFREAQSGAASLELLAPGRSAIVLDRINGHYDELDPLNAVRITSNLGSSRSRSWLYLPRRPADPPLPLVVIPYPGSTWSDLPPSIDAAPAAASNDNVRVLLAAGYAVLRPGMPEEADVDRRPETIVAQVNAAVDAAIAAGGIDPDRVAIMGHSFGAYAAITVATRSDRFRAVIAENGIYDLVANHATMAGGDSIRMEAGLPFASTGWTEGGQGAMGMPPSDAPQRYLDASPVRSAAAACMPILLVHGDVDAVSVAGSERLFLELARHGHDVSMIRYHGEGHVIHSPANIRDYYARTLAFLAERMPPPTRQASAEGTRNAQLQARNHASKLACTTRDR